MTEAPPSRSGFIGRSRELLELHAALSPEGQNLLCLVGQRRVGKSSLLREFAARHAELFPGGIEFIDYWAAAQRSDPPVVRTLSKRRKSLIVFDEFPPGDPAAVDKSLKIHSRYPNASAVFASEQLIRNLPSTTWFMKLQGLRIDEWNSVGRAPGLDEDTLSRFYEAFHGSPYAFQLLQQHRAEGLPGANLLDELLPFREPGIVGPDGKPYGTKAADLPSPVVQICTHLEAKLFEAVSKNPDLMHSISPRDFEFLVAELLSRDGFDVQVTPPSKDGGIDIFAAKSLTLGRILFLVECKRYAMSNPVQVDVVRALHGTVSARKATAGVVVTTSRFTKGARLFQESVKHQMELHDYIKLREWLNRLR